MAIMKSSLVKHKPTQPIKSKGHHKSSSAVKRKVKRPTN
jgi:hypothetical protein